MTTSTNNLPNRDPGDSALAFIRTFTKGLPREEVPKVIEQLRAGELHDKSDERIKSCDYCRWYFRDPTRPGNAKTCSRSCKTATDTVKRAVKKVVADKVNGVKKRLTTREKHYASEREYSYWSDEAEMIAYTARYETSTDILEQIEGAIYRDTKLGGKKKGSPVIAYNGDESKQATVNVKFVQNDSSSSEVRVSTMKASEIDAYYIEKYGEKHMQREWARI